MGYDKVTRETNDTTTGNEITVMIELNGDPGSFALDLGAKPDWMTDAEWDAWQERIDSDIEFLRTTHSGRAGLEALDQASKDSEGFWWWQDTEHIRILPYQPSDGGPASFDQWADAVLNGERLPGSNPAIEGPQTSIVGWDRSYQTGDRVAYGHTNVGDFNFGPPSLTLQHELSHAYDSLHGGVEDGDEEYTEIRRDAQGNEIQRARVSRAELNSVGLDTDGNGDPDTIETDDGTAHPDAFTENALRDELRKPRRDSYTMGTQPRPNRERITYENAT